jgi:hypothetical protein
METRAQAAGMNWTGEQQRLLGAMGYELLVRASVAAAAAPEAVMAATGAPARARPPAANAAAAQASERFAALRQAVLRAAGGHAGAEALLADCERLRCEPAAKRALWPRLRALRRSH